MLTAITRTNDGQTIILAVSFNSLSYSCNVFVSAFKYFKTLAICGIKNTLIDPPAVAAQVNPQAHKSFTQKLAREGAIDLAVACSFIEHDNQWQFDIIFNGWGQQVGFNVPAIDIKSFLVPLLGKGR